LPRIQCGVFALGGASARRPILQAEARTSPAAAGGINLRVAPSAMSTPEQQRNAAQAPSWQRLWTPDHAAELQAAVDQIFENNAGSLKDMRFSVTVADPSVKDAPLVGCSEGFSELCGYRMDEIVGRNCRFLVDPVPKDLVDPKIRLVAREFTNSVRDGLVYTMPEELRQEYMPLGRHKDDGIFCLQMNARKDGRLFRNMFYLRAISLNDKPYIIGLQTEIPEGADYDVYHEACRLLDENLSSVEGILAKKFWVQGPMRRQTNKGQQLPGEVAPQAKVGLKQPWSQEQGEQLQQAIDRIFGKGGEQLKWLRMSLTLADPALPECPLIGCSTGFGTLCGYTMNEIVGRNCRFLVDPVPPHMINKGVRDVARNFTNAVRAGKNYQMPPDMLQPWMPPMTQDQGVFCAQMNAKKDGSLFENMFYLVKIDLDERPYIVGLQTGLPAGTLTMKSGDGGVLPNEEDANALQACYQACRVLDANMGEVERSLAAFFWLSAPMRRQEVLDDDGFVDDPGKDPNPAPVGGAGGGKGKRKDCNGKTCGCTVS